MQNLIQTVTLPSYRADTLIEWLARAAKAAESASKFIDAGTAFANRACGDNRLHVRDASGMLTNDFAVGEFFDGATRKILWCGTLDERNKGMFSMDRAEYDGDEDLTSIRSWSETVPLRDLVLPSTHGRRMNGGTYVDSDPCEMAYQLIAISLCLQPASRIFAIKTRQGDGAMFCFPMAWGSQKDLYLIVTINGRYGDLESFFFQGDVAAYAKLKVRGPRCHEVDAFYEDRDNWGPIEAPALLSHTYDGMNPAPPSAVELRNVVEASNALKRLEDNTGQAGWLTNGG